MSHKIMSRGVTQALYKYLPGSWGTFYDKSTRKSLGSEIKTWYSLPLDSVNSKRVLKKINQMLEGFRSRGGKVEGFGSDISAELFSLRQPSCYSNKEKPDIISKLQPRVFYCSRCNRVHDFRFNNGYEKNNGRCSYCKGYLKQIMLAYVCECNSITAVYPRKCNKHGNKNLKYNPSIEPFKFICGECGKKIDMNHYCDKCNARLYPRNSVQRANFIPFSVHMINLINSVEEEFLVSNDLAPRAIIGRYLDVIDEQIYQNIIENADNMVDPTEHPDYKKRVEFFMTALGQTQAAAEVAAAQMIAGDISSNEVKIVNDFVNTKFNNIYENFLSNTATSILEFNTILNAPNSLSFDKATEQAIINRTILDEGEYKNILNKFGISKIQGSSPVPLVNCVYGYTRLTSDPDNAKHKPLTLAAFPAEDGKRQIYGMRLETEGILIEFDRKRIIEWMIKNEFLDINVAPDTNDDNAMKLWFLNNVDLEEITPFSEIDELVAPYTSRVYKLLHSISHALIKNCNLLSGLDADSLSEYIFPNIPAIFIYCQNNQGITLGSLYSLMETYLDKWFYYTLNSVEKCVFDPVCLSNDKACIGCLYINEVSCRHFNKDLNREFLIGNYDHDTKKQIYGYWEDAYGDNASR